MKFANPQARFNELPFLAEVNYVLYKVYPLVLAKLKLTFTDGLSPDSHFLK